MSIGSIFKKVVSGAGQALAGPEPARPDATATAMPDLGLDVPDFQLPQLDENDPDYEDKKAIHDAYEELGRMHTEHARGAGEQYKTMYNDLAKGVREQATGKEFSPLSALMIGMGSDKGLENVQAHNQSVKNATHQRDQDLLSLKERALRGQIDQFLAEGKFSQALKAQALLADVAAVQDRTKAERAQQMKIEQLGITEEGKNKRAEMINTRMVQVADRRMKILQAQLGKLSDADKFAYQTKLAAVKSEYAEGIGANKLTGRKPSEEKKGELYDEMIRKTNALRDEMAGLTPGDDPAFPDPTLETTDVGGDPGTAFNDGKTGDSQPSTGAEARDLKYKPGAEAVPDSLNPDAPAAEPKTPAEKKSAALEGSGGLSPDQRVVVVRNGQKVAVSRKFLKDGEQVIGIVKAPAAPSKVQPRAKSER